MARRLEAIGVDHPVGRARASGPRRDQRATSAARSLSHVMPPNRRGSTNRSSRDRSSVQATCVCGSSGAEAGTTPNEPDMPSCTTSTQPFAPTSASCLPFERRRSRHDTKRAGHAQLYDEHAAVCPNQRKLLAMSEDVVNASPNQQSIRPAPGASYDTPTTHAGIDDCGSPQCGAHLTGDSFDFWEFRHAKICGKCRA